MSKNKRLNHRENPATFLAESADPPLGEAENSIFMSAAAKLVLFLKTNFVTLLVLGFLSLGVLGAGLKFLEEDARRQQLIPAGNNRSLRESSWLNLVNPFLPAPSPEPLQVSKEYVYLGSRMLAVEEPNARAASPADLAVWRPATGVWWVMGGQNSQSAVEAWGMNGDVPAEGDYDGDGETDFCVFRPSSNQWWILKSSDGNFYSAAFGNSGDKTAQADFDGDGKTDLAVFRPSNGVWYIRQSSNDQTIQRQFGLSSDTPNPKDFDGDGRADLAVWRSSNKTFYSLNSTDAALQTATFAQSSNFPVSGDYDGDGRADFAIRSGADWIIRHSAGNQTFIVNWQEATDTAVQNDYDGDGKTDIAVWRPSSGVWFIRQSSNGQLRQQAWGTAGDFPVPAFYRR